MPIVFAKPKPQFVAFDDFSTQSDGRLITVDPTNWEAGAWGSADGSTGWYVLSNAVRHNGGFGSWGIDIHKTAPSSADYNVQADVIVATNTRRQGVVARASASNFDGYYFYHLLGTGYRISRIGPTNGASTVLDTAGSALAGGDPVTLRLEVIGSSIKGYADDVEVVSATNSDVTQIGQGGMISYASFSIVEGSLDNFNITNI